MSISDGILGYVASLCLSFTYILEQWLIPCRVIVKIKSKIKCLAQGLVGDKYDIIIVTR